MKPYTCFFAAHGCCRSANSKGNSPLSGGHRGSGSTAVKKQPCPPLFYFLLYGTNLHRRGGTISYRMPPFSFLFFPRLLLTTSARLAPLSRTTPPALKALSSPFQKWAEPASCFRFVFFYYYWMMPRLPAQNGLCFFFIQQQQSGASCLSLGLRVAMATAAVQSVCPEDAHSGPVCVCVSSSVLTEQGHFTFLSAVGNTKEWPQLWRSREFMEAACRGNE